MMDGGFNDDLGMGLAVEDYNTMDGAQQLTQAAADILGLQDKLLSGGKAFNDPVHGFFKLPQYAIALMDTPQFQRLRDLKQLGVTYYVFPGASHNRFEHSVGTAYLAWSVAGRLMMLQGKSLDLRKTDVAVATLAGLCHDLGHGPFSHVFDSELVKELGMPDFEHEEMSVKLFDRAVDVAMQKETTCEVLRNLEAEDFRMVKDMIANGKGPKCRRDRAPYRRGYLFDIVANSTNSIDVDKFDYILRDAYYTGVKVAFEYKPVTATMQIFDDEICFRRSQVHNLYELFHARSSMHRRVYTHPKAKAMEYMIVDALCEAADHLEIRDKITDADAFLELDDTVLKQIEWYKGEDPRMLKAKDIVGRLRRRDIYTCCGDVVVPKEMAMRPDYKKVKKEDVLNSCMGITADDIVIHDLKIDFAMGSQNPLENVKLYESGSSEAKTMPMSGMSTMYVSEPIERRVRVFLKSRDPEKVQLLQESFSRWGNRTYGADHFATATPVKGRPASFAGQFPKRERDENGNGELQLRRRKIL